MYSERRRSAAERSTKRAKQNPRDVRHAGFFFSAEQLIEVAQQVTEQPRQGFPFRSSLGRLLFPRFSLPCGRFWSFGWTTTRLSSLGGRLSSRRCAETPAAMKHPTAKASNFCLKLNILISNPPHALSAHGRESRDAPFSLGARIMPRKPLPQFATNSNKIPIRP